MSCADFCSLLNFFGGVLFVILALLVQSGHKYQEWEIKDDDKSKVALFISAGIHFGLCIVCIIWKFLKQQQIARQQQQQQRTEGFKFFEIPKNPMYSSDRGEIGNGQLVINEGQ